MAHHNPAAHSEALTGIRKEEAWVDKHAGAVDRLINSREFKLGTLTYTETGHVPTDKFWTNLAKQEEKNPTRFDLKNPGYVGFFTSPAKVGELPAGNMIFDVMKQRDETQPAVFAAHHKFYVGLVNRDIALENLATATPPVTTGTGTTGDGTGTSGTTPTGTSGSTTGSGSGTTAPELGDPGNLSPNSVPEPASILMVAAGLFAAVAARRLRGRQPA